MTQRAGSSSCFLATLLNLFRIFSKVDHSGYDDFGLCQGVEHGVGKSAEKAPAMACANPLLCFGKFADAKHHSFEFIQERLSKAL